MHQLHLQEIAPLMGASSQEKNIFSGVSVDSRLHQPENLFFALPGAKADGHQFLGDVASKGARGVVVRSDYAGPDYGLNLLYVKDPLQALQDLAKQILKRSSTRVVAVTGSVGKTTTKDFITTLLKEKFKVASSPGNSNSQTGVPLAILNHTIGKEDIFVVEMGMTHPGNIKQLISIAPPECAVITNAALVHACNFASVEEIAKTKAEILEHPETRMGIIQRDIVNYAEIAQCGSYPKISFSWNHPEADFILDSQDSLRIKTRVGQYDLGVFPIQGKHNRINFLAAATCARYFNLTWEEIATGMHKLTLPALRWQTFEKQGIYFINDCYNSSPIALKAALESMPLPAQGGRKIAVLADMLELGQFSEGAHREIAQHALTHVDQIFCYGQECKHIHDVWQKSNRPSQWFSERKDVVNFLKDHLKKGDVVLIKGSKSTYISKLLDEWEILTR